MSRKNRRALQKLADKTGAIVFTSPLEPPVMPQKQDRAPDEPEDKPEEKE